MVEGKERRCVWREYGRGEEEMLHIARVWSRGGRDVARGESMVEGRERHCVWQEYLYLSAVSSCYIRYRPAGFLAYGLSSTAQQVQQTGQHGAVDDYLVGYSDTGQLKTW